MTRKTMTVAAVQMDCTLDDWTANTNKAEHFIQEAVSQQAEFVVLPELFNTGYRVEESDRTAAETIPGKTSSWMMQTASNYGITLAASYIEKTPAFLYDTAVLVDASGVLGSYRKKYLWDMENERFSEGNSRLEPFTVGPANVGMQICYEVGFPEPSRLLTLNGADMIVYPSAFGKARSYVWDIATRARAVENGIFIIAANRTGVEKEETVFGGKSRIVSPKGEVLKEAVQDNEVIVETIDLSEVNEQRSQIPYLKDLDRTIYNPAWLAAKQRRVES